MNNCKGKFKNCLDTLKILCYNKSIEGGKVMGTLITIVLAIVLFGISD